MNTSNRRRIIYIPAERILDLFALRKWRDGDSINYPKPTGLPEDVKVLSVHEDYCRNAFAVSVEHPSFDEVPPAIQSPQMHIEWEWAKVETKP